MVERADSRSARRCAFDAGSFYALPPSLLLQWHFLPEGTIRPYVGAGINYTHISRVKLSVPGVLPLYLDSSSVGPALQAGFDFKLDGPWSLNFDIKKTWIESDIRTGAGVRVSKVKIDPMLIGIGVGYRF